MFGLPTGLGVTLLVAAILLADVAIFLLVVRPAIRRRTATARADVTEAAGGAFILKEGPARSLGEESRGRAQARGNGYLAITDDEIVFALIAPRRTLRIPRHAVLAVEQTRSHLGKTSGRPLTKITWTRDDGAPDSVAFDLPGAERDAWTRAFAGA